MIRFLIFLSLVASLNASKILSYNIYDRTDRVDVMITFDTPYHGVIKQNTTNSKIIIKLEDASIESAKSKHITSRFIQSLNIVPMSGYTQIIASIPHSISLKASKTSDSYGLRLRFSKKATQTKKQTGYTNPLSSLPTKKTDEMQKNYYIVIFILIIGIAILLYLKRKFPTTQQKQPKQKQNSWLFKHNDSDTPQTTTQQTQQTPIAQNTGEDSVSIRFQKTINEHTSVVMLDFMSQSYLVLMGKNNILLDKFTDNQPASQDDFETILQQRHEELERFINEEDILQPQTKEPLQAYKERAASIAYDA